jgi:transposase-like protein
MPKCATENFTRFLPLINQHQQQDGTFYFDEWARTRPIENAEKTAAKLLSGGLIFGPLEWIALRLNLI